MLGEEREKARGVKVYRYIEEYEIVSRVKLIIVARWTVGVMLGDERRGRGKSKYIY